MLIEKPPGTSLAEPNTLLPLQPSTARQSWWGEPAVSTPCTTGPWRGWAVGNGDWSLGRVVRGSHPDAGLGHPPSSCRLLAFANSLHGIDLLPIFTGEIDVVQVWGRNLDPTRGEPSLADALDGVGEWVGWRTFIRAGNVPGVWRLVVDAPGLRMVSAPLESASLLVRGRSVEEVEASVEDLRFKPGFHGQSQEFPRCRARESTLAWPACSIEAALSAMELAARITDACHHEPLTPCLAVR